MKPMSEDKARQWGGVIGCGGEWGGACLPTVGPLSMHAGPQMSVRGCHRGAVFEGRCDMPLSGSPLVGVHHRRGMYTGARRIHGGAVPYALSSTAFGFTPQEAVAHAIMGAIHAADASELVTHPDRYKLMAVHARMQGVQPAAVQHYIAEAVYADAFGEAQARGVEPGVILGELARQLGTHPSPEHIAAAIHQDVQQHGFRA